MEALYAKLYDKYTGLKAKRFGELDAAQKDQEAKFSTCFVGYSFTLTWTSNDDEMELMNNVLSLGTLERISPEWMREVIKFRACMCPVFFKRITDVTKSRGTFR